MRRRRFLRGAAWSTVALSPGCRRPRGTTPPADAGRLELRRLRNAPVAPLDTLEIVAQPGGILHAFDGQGREYLRQVVMGSTQLRVGGALGWHTLELLDERGVVRGRTGFDVAARTELHDDDGRFARLLALARWTLHKDYNLLGRHVRLHGRTYHFLVYWLRDHVFTLEGARYYQDELRGGIDLYASLQREDGMIWDNVEPRTQTGYWDTILRERDFMRDVDDGRWEVKRIPVTNDVEALFVEGLHLTWQATGDDAWMKGHLDRAVLALRYSRTDPLRWSQPHGLLHRGYTIDAWDFQSQWDADHDTGHFMTISDETEMGVNFGDNQLYANACEHLAQMLEVAGRADEAAAHGQRAREIRARVDQVAWHGTHYRHHVPDNPAVPRDLGIDDRTQVSLSNAYALSRGIDDEHAQAIIGTYQRLRDDLPPGSPGEWYAIHPPFPRGFPTAPPWEYVNGGVLPTVAAELARGSLTRGHEAYGVDILERLRTLAERHGDVLHGAYRGAAASPPQRVLSPVSLGALANARHPPADATVDGAPLVPAAGPRGAVVREFAGIPFSLVDPAAAPERTALVLHRDQGRDTARLLLSGPLGAVYLLHDADGATAGALVFEYADRSSARVSIGRTMFGNWWADPQGEWPRPPAAHKAWRTEGAPHVALFVAGIDNPSPEKSVRALRFESTTEGRHWRVVGVTTSDTPTYFAPGAVSYGIPRGWGAGAIIRTVIESLGGVEDRGAGMSRVRLSPRWAATGQTDVTLCARYGDGSGYVRYHFAWTPPRGPLQLTFTGNAEHMELSVLLPEGFAPRAVNLDGQEQPLAIHTVRRSRYLAAQVSGVGVHALLVS